ncbi:MAG: hypothetical protein KF886_05015 [Candidatus Hydrogenedentes bacterium]|nr:hypothetical protein [Candidatus Hydrogenedentota bacterium]
MAEFATEAGVRLHVQADDESVASGALIAACIAEAHERVLAALRADVDEESPPGALIQGETLIASAVLLRALASREAVEQVTVQIGGQRVDIGQKFASLMSIARRFEREADLLLGPFVRRAVAASPVLLTRTTPVLGR